MSTQGQPLSAKSPSAVRVALAGSFVAVAVVGCLFLFGHWSARGSLPRALATCAGFTAIMALVHVAGYRAYLQQPRPKLDADEHDTASAGPSLGRPLAPEYVAALQLAVIEQVLLLGLSALMLDGGRTLRLCAIAAVAYWAAALLIITRRPSAPGRTDRTFLRYGYLVLPVVAGVLSRF